MSIVKYLLMLVILLAGFKYVFAQQISHEKVREQFFTMDRSGASGLYNLLRAKDLTKDPVMLAYRGAALAASAGSAQGVWAKLECFNNGKSEIEKAVELKPLNVEVRFLRLATQVNAPGFLGYASEVKNDRAMIINSLLNIPGNHANAYLYLRICRFILAQAEPEKGQAETVNLLIIKFNSRK